MALANRDGLSSSSLAAHHIARRHSLARTRSTTFSIKQSF
jgi:hypothetical protein